jgi:hypothetical protein
MVPESTRLTVDMLCQILPAPIIDVGKTLGVIDYCCKPVLLALDLGKQYLKKQVSLNKNLVLGVVSLLN